MAWNKRPVFVVNAGQYGDTSTTKLTPRISPRLCAIARRYGQGKPLQYPGELIGLPGKVQGRAAKEAESVVADPMRAIEEPSNRLEIADYRAGPRPNLP